jgi:hypothetical protein
MFAFLFNFVIFAFARYPHLYNSLLMMVIILTPPSRSFLLASPWSFCWVVARFFARQIGSSRAVYPYAFKGCTPWILPVFYE